MEKNDKLWNNETSVECIDGVFRPYTQCIGYCNNICHKGFVTTKLLQQHQCIEKACNFLDLMKGTKYWFKIEKKKAHKLEIKKYREMEKLILEKAKELHPKKVEIVMCKHLYDSTYILVATKSKIDVTLPKAFKKELGIKVYVSRINECQIKNIQYTYKLLLTKEMLEKANNSKQRKKC